MIGGFDFSEYTGVGSGDMGAVWMVSLSVVAKVETEKVRRMVAGAGVVRFLRTSTLELQFNGFQLNYAAMSKLSKYGW